MTRQEHLDWCKKRALEYVENGDVQQAVASMLSDLEKHSETAGHAGSQIGVMLLLGGFLNGSEKVKDWITGFN